MHPILNLKRLNAAHLNTPYFQMETVEDVRHALRPGDWAASIDLHDSYFHVPLHEEIHELWWRGRLYRLCVLPFSLSPAPKVFTALTKFIRVYSRLGHWGRGGPHPSSPRFLSSVLGRPARGILIYSLVAFLPRFGLSAA
jgi:hypothetical protein